MEEEKNIKYYNDIIDKIDKLRNEAIAIERNLSNKTMKNRIIDKLDTLDELRSQANFKLNEMNIENIEKPEISFIETIKEMSSKELYRHSRKFFYNLDKRIADIQNELDKRNDETRFIFEEFPFALLAIMPADDRVSF